jgi:hypothetical protein
VVKWQKKGLTKSHSAIPVGEIGYPSDGIAVSAEKW